MANKRIFIAFAIENERIRDLLNGQSLNTFAGQAGRPLMTRIGHSRAPTGRLCPSFVGWHADHTHGTLRL